MMPASVLAASFSLHNNLARRHDGNAISISNMEKLSPRDSAYTELSSRAGIRHLGSVTPERTLCNLHLCLTCWWYPFSHQAHWLFWMSPCVCPPSSDEDVKFLRLLALQMLHHTGLPPAAFAHVR